MSLSSWSPRCQQCCLYKSLPGFALDPWEPRQSLADVSGPATVMPNRAEVPVYPESHYWGTGSFLLYDPGLGAKVPAYRESH